MLVYLQAIDSPEERSKFERLYERYRALMYKVAYDILKHEQDAEDVVHQAFLKIAENMSKIGDVASKQTKAFLVTIVENRAIDLHRAKTRHPTVPYEDETIGYYVEYTGSFDLARVIANLPGKYREVLYLKHIHGLNNNEVANVLGLSVSNVSKIEQRAKRKLMQMCKAEDLL